MEIADVVDGKTLTAYLNEVSDDEQQQIQLRVDYCGAVRVLPIALHFLYFGPSSVVEASLTAESLFADIAIAGFLKDDIVRANKAIVGLPSVTAYKLSAVASANDNMAAHDAANAILEVNSRTRSDEKVHAYPYAARFAISAARRINLNLVEAARRDLNSPGPIWPHGLPGKIQEMWNEVQQAMEADAVDWSIWIHWYNRVLQDRDWHPKAMGEVLETITGEDWEKGPAHINPMFDEVLALYLKEDAATSDAGGQDRSTSHLKTIRAQVLTLQEFLQTEYVSLAGHNARSPEQDDILELLKALRALVDDMIAQLDRSDDEKAMAVVRETLPAVVEQAGELAVIEPEPVVSSTVATMSATIRSLTEAGADPELATKFAISEAAGKKLWPRIKGLFGRK